jgi:hypothetical protein
MVSITQASWQVVKGQGGGGRGRGWGYMAFMAWAAELGAHCLCV